MLNPKQDTNYYQRILKLDENLSHKGNRLSDFSHF